MLPRISLLAAIVVLVAIILRTTEHEFAVEEVIETHSFNTYHFLADPLAVDKIYPPVASLVSRLVDARVLGKNEEAVEQYDLMVSADLPYLGNQTFAVSMMADSRRHYVVKDLATLYGMIKVTVAWKVEETGPNKLHSRLILNVHTRLPAICWLFVDQSRLQAYEGFFNAAMERTKARIASSH